jgi:CRISPR-associated endonuclease/helicase Cas3
LVQKRLKSKIEEKWAPNFRPVQVYMKEHKDENLVVIAPTGSGKTEAALLWIDGEKGFYTLPLKVSSNAIYERIQNVYDYKHVLLLHSDSMMKYLEESSEDKEIDGYTKYEKAKLLSAPLTICTVDQLFKFVYKALGQKYLQLL